jgi:demethylmenaquinone methyltransferase/2-methoxy-6-polyprenyl-1,4-benzoquinol methylase
MRGRSAYRRLYDRLLSRVYDLYMAWYMLPFGGEQRFRRKMLDGLAFRPGERLLDCTCGTGGCTAVLRERAGPEMLLVASDLSLGQLRMASCKPTLAGVPLLGADASGLPFRDGAFDSVFIPHALHEMPRAVRSAVLREARRVCCRDGRVVVLELDQPSRPWLRCLIGLWFLYWIPPPLNFETRTRRDLQRRGLVWEVSEAGFRTVRKLSKYAGTMQVVEARGGDVAQRKRRGAKWVGRTGTVLNGSEGG